MSPLSAVSRHGSHHHHRCRRLPFLLHPNLTTLPWNSSIENDSDEKRHEIKQQHRMHHNTYRVSPLLFAAASTTATSASSYPIATRPSTHHYRQRQRQHSCFHSTTRKEILPFLVVGGIIGVSAMYAYKTFQQIDRDWENYYKAVEEYKAKTGIDLENEDGSLRPQQDGTTSSSMSGRSRTESANLLSTFFTGGILAIDMGTRRMKLAHLPRPTDRRTTATTTSPGITVDREGYRFTPSLVWIPPASSSSDDYFRNNEFVSGRSAEARLYDVKGGHTLPLQDILAGKSHKDDEAIFISQTIRNEACNALDQVLGGGGGTTSSSTNSSKNVSSSKNKNPLFVLDASLSTLSGSYNVRPIFTYPTTTITRNVTLHSSLSGGEEKDQSYYLDQYRRAIANLTSPAGIASYVPEPIAIVTGAEFFNLLPPEDAASSSSLGKGNNSILVVDVGGTTTCVSLVRGGGERDHEEEILYSASIPFGGDTFIDLLVSHLVRDFYGQRQGNEEHELAASEINLSTRPKLNDPTALQRLHEASTTAIHELSNKTRTEINVPYLTLDMQTRLPKHLKLGMSRNVVNVEVETWIRTKLVPYLMREQGNNPSMFVLSQATPPPTNLATLFASAIMSALELTSHTPYMLRAILAVGGGSRIPLVREAIREGVENLAGEAYAIGGKGKRLIIPEGEMCDELGALGAAVWGSMR